MPKRGLEEWWWGGDPNHEYEVLGYQLVNGVRVEIEWDERTGLVKQDSLPDPERFLPSGDITSILVHLHPKDDSEGGRYFWVHNPLGGTPADWLKHIYLAASRYEIDLEVDVQFG